MTDRVLAELERAVVDSPGTVTDFLESLIGEPLVADVVRQGPVVLDAGNDLEAVAGYAATRRIAVLKGGTTDQPYVYAETLFVRERLPEPARSQLERTTDPIGRVLVAHGLHPDREPLAPPGEATGQAPGAVTALDSDIVWSRAYRLRIDGQPVFAIREWFLRSVLDAFDHRVRG
ncbi:MAG TPA: chorismate pyruvate-lyase family protein [Acidimicrobiales bacterium]